LQHFKNLFIFATRIFALLEFILFYFPFPFATAGVAAALGTGADVVEVAPGFAPAAATGLDRETTGFGFSLANSVQYLPEEGERKKQQRNQHAADVKKQQTTYSAREGLIRMALCRYPRRVSNGIAGAAGGAFGPAPGIGTDVTEREAQKCSSEIAIFRYTGRRVNWECEREKFYDF
jgi:hypothetical protein